MRPEIDSPSDAVTDTVPPCPEPKVEPVIEAPPVKMIVSARTLTSPDPPGPDVADEIPPLSMVRVGVETKTGPACPEPKVLLAMPPGTFVSINVPSWKVP